MLRAKRDGKAVRFLGGTQSTTPKRHEPSPLPLRKQWQRRGLIVGTEVHRRRSGGHLGHLFENRPVPTSKRYCMNGVALQFVAT
ncbi:peptide-methionine (R)-S-oxide reductase [Phormidium tenue FACHB-886]|nr:peptide-methionine (R)-S-oxide reductase [Phormidium tenue FACHB-886]